MPHLPWLLVALAAPPVEAACPAVHADAAALIEVGDVAWIHGDRRTAACAWRAAWRAGEADPAVRAMAALRRLRTSGNLGLAVHGPRADRALDDCPTTLGRCALARADRALLTTELGLADEASRAVLWAEEAAALDPDLALAAQVRLAQVGALPVHALPASEVAAPGAATAAALAEVGGTPEGPGTWSLGLGVVGAPQLGAGPLLRFAHPDVGWRGWRLDAEAWATSAGAARLAAGLRTRGRPWLSAGVAGARLLVPLYGEDGSVLGRDEVLGVQLRALPGLDLGPASAWLGPELRLDQPAGAAAAVPGHGLVGGLGVSTGTRTRGRAILRGTRTLFGPDHLDASLDLALWQPAPLAATLALRAIGSAAPLASSPTWRQPAWGGGEVLRSAPLGYLRAPWMAAVLTEWRQPLVGPLGLALHAEAAWADAPLLGGGGGLRLHLPPRPPTTVRVDLAAGTAGWALTAGWGEAW